MTAHATNFRPGSAAGQVEPNTAAALEFLTRWAPEGPWVLTAIAVERKGIETATFYPGDNAEAWIEKYNGQRNIYFHVNPPVRDLTRKAERSDIARVDWLHVDIDPRAGEDLDAERERALGLLTERLPKGVPRPTCIVFSGGGYQGFWRLKEPIPVEGDLAAAEEAARYNQQLELRFGADKCHNIDRIMRLPGTVNLPDKKKQAKGRTAQLAELVEFDASRTYALGEFTKAAAAPSAERQPAAVAVPEDVRRLGSVEELDQWNVPDRIKEIIVQGRRVDEGPKEGDDSRSAWLFDALCGLVRAGVPDAVIYAAITDPDFRISESVLDKPTPRRYGERQIQRAKEEAEEPLLRQLNDQHAVIANFGGKCVVVEEVEDPALKRTRLTAQSFTDFRGRYMHVPVQVGTNKDGLPVKKPLGRWWLEHPHRRQYSTVVFAPGREVEGAYNLWKGFGVEPRPGSGHEPFLQHLHENVCAGDDGHYDYLVRWMARAVQHPDTPGEVAVVLRGGRGTGKGTVAKHFGRLFGRHYHQVTNAAHLVGQFNAHLRDTVLLFGDEAFFAGDRQHESVLKGLVTESQIVIERKHVDAEPAPNYIHLLMASNDNWVVPAGADERRFFVLDVGDAHKQDSRYFAHIERAMEGGGYENLLHFLQTLDLSEFEVRTVPQTAALRDQQAQSLRGVAAYVYDRLWKGEVPACAVAYQGTPWASSSGLQQEVAAWLNVSQSRVSTNEIGSTLHEQLGAIKKVNWQVGRNGLHGYFWDTATLRQRWDERMFQVEWPDLPAGGRWEDAY